MLLDFIGNTIVTVPRWTVIAAINVLKLGLEVIKVVLLLLGLVAKIFLGFVKASIV